MTEDQDPELTEEEKNYAAKFLIQRDSPNDMLSLEGSFTAHDSLRSLSYSMAVATPEGDPIREEEHRIRDVIEDHERLLRLVTYLHAVISNSVTRLDGPSWLPARAKTREQLGEALRTIGAETSRLYLTDI
jgi:hypothetical protein